MAHEYFKCRICGTVQRHKDDTSIARLLENPDQPCANARCSARAAGDYDVCIGKSDLGGVQSRSLAQRMVGNGKGATTIYGWVTFNYVEPQRHGPPKYRQESSRNRDISDALVRLAKGTALPVDVNKRVHFHDGGKYNGGNLPIRNVKHATVYYREYGILSSSKGWEVNLSSERLVVGNCGEIYYSSLHYKPGHWWVFNASNNRMGWYPFVLRP